MPENIEIDPEDLIFEEEISHDKTMVRSWCRYLDHKSASNPLSRFVVYERALALIPGSYKLWKRYINDRMEYLGTLDCSPHHAEILQMQNVFRKCLLYMHKMPRLWTDYLGFLTKYTYFLTDTRRSFDAALQALPITQHDRVWPLYLEFIQQHSLQHSFCQIYRRYLQFNKSDTEDYIDYLLSTAKESEAILLLIDFVNDTSLTSKKTGVTKPQLWIKLCELVSKHAFDFEASLSSQQLLRTLFSDSSYYAALSGDLIIRSALVRYPDIAGKLWCLLADYYSSHGKFSQSIAVYEEGLASIKRFSCFSVIYEAFMTFYEKLTSAILEKAPEEDEEAGENLDTLLKRLELLIERRPIMVNDVLLRQNPHNVMEWLKRLELLSHRPEKKIQAFTDAIEAINPAKATGNLSEIWIAMVNFYLEHEQLDEARMVCENAIQANYTTTNDLVQFWCFYAELELKHELECQCDTNPKDHEDHQDVEDRNSRISSVEKCRKRALEVVKRATSWHPLSLDTLSLDELTENHPMLAKLTQDEKEKYHGIHAKVHKSLKLWTMYADLEEHYGDFGSTKSVYERILDLKIINIETLLSYANFTWEHKYFEQCFKIYEKGLSLFNWPAVHEIWTVYLTRFVERYKNTELERSRDLFEQVLSESPYEYLKDYTFSYVDFEEKFGTPRRALRVLEKTAGSLKGQELYDCLLVLAKKQAQTMGLVHAREVYEKAIEVLPNKFTGPMCLHFISLELSLGEVERVRQLYAYASEFYDPRVQISFWKQWSDFEISLGNEDTYREYLKTKRTQTTVFTSRVSLDMAEKMSNISSSSEFLSAGYEGSSPPPPPA